jgi:hypothetical protein
MYANSIVSVEKWNVLLQMDGCTKYYLNQRYCKSRFRNTNAEAVCGCQKRF